MECMDAVRHISGFLNDELNDEVLSPFIEHVRDCDECRDELAIQYLATEGIVRLEEGASFSLDDELEMKLRSGEKRLTFHERFEFVCRGFEVAGIFFMVVAVVVMMW